MPQDTEKNSSRVFFIPKKKIKIMNQKKKWFAEKASFSLSRQKIIFLRQAHGDLLTRMLFVCLAWHFNKIGSSKSWRGQTLNKVGMNSWLKWKIPVGAPAPAPAPATSSFSRRSVEVWPLLFWGNMVMQIFSYRVLATLGKGVVMNKNWHHQIPPPPPPAQPPPPPPFVYIEHQNHRSSSHSLPRRHHLKPVSLLIWANHQLIPFGSFKTAQYISMISGKQEFEIHSHFLL